MRNTIEVWYDYYCINSLHSARSEKASSHEKECKNHDYCHVIMTEKKNNYGQKYLKIPFFIFADTESLLGQYIQKITVQKNCQQK